MSGPPYSDEELLPLSGIQHFYFCKRQWALIHVEQSWEESQRTAEGRVIHQRVDDPDFSEIRNGVTSLRSVHVVSRDLGLFGICDMVEYILKDGTMNIWPVEYKVGKPKIDDRDHIQLCAQCICLEEMYDTQIDVAYIYYHARRRRSEVKITEELRDLSDQMSAEMHSLFDKGLTPPPIKNKRCILCSLNNICMPSLGKTRGNVEFFIENILERKS